MSGKRVKMLRRAVRAVFAGDFERSWQALLALPTRARLIMAWRLALGMGANGK
jgi:hypothetical protein